ncbi:DUF4190 domain-containing protein [Streptomyces sp. NPDC035033]|uniref:DUF4190 domain-containing protein n=1 Tax=Streptomyces sp. NPDC035033 TaxID=3155368 RepID=UPI003401AB13
MSDTADPRPQDRGASDPWAPPERREEPVDLGKRPVHDQPTVTSIPTGDPLPAQGPAPAGEPSAGELPPPPVAPGGPAAFGAPAPPYGHPPAGPSAYGYPAAGPTSYGYPPVHSLPYGPLPGQNNGMGTAGMVLGIIGTCLFWFYGVPSIVLGVLALIFGILGRKRAHRGEASNGGTATAGVVLGIVSMVLGTALIAFVVWAVMVLDDHEKSDPGESTSAVLVVGDR